SQLVSSGPMNYAFNRQVIKLDSVDRSDPLQIELFPAFAHLRAEEKWSAGVRVAFLSSTPTPDPLPGAELTPAASSSVQLAMRAFEPWSAQARSWVVRSTT